MTEPKPLPEALPEALVDQSIARVRKAVAIAGKKPLARRADVAPGVLRRIADEDFSCTTDSLRGLERAADEILDESDVDEAANRRGESGRPILRKTRAA